MSSNGMTLQVEQLYREYKPLLTSISYQMLGSVSEAEDAVQDVFVAVSKLDMADITNPKAYLVKMITNRTLNMMKAAPRNRENYPGQWLPEPVIEPGSENEPQEHILRREQLGYALLVLLQTCTPPERAVFVLRESLGHDYADIAAILNKSEAACRKIYSRAIAKIGHRSRIDNEAALDASIDRFVQSFIQATDTGRFESFIHLLAEDAVLLSDGGGVVRAALNPIVGRDRIGAFFSGIAGKGSLKGTMIQVSISGQRGLLLQRADGPPFAFTFEPNSGLNKVRSVYLISNPEKLTRIKGVTKKLAVT
ncbi:ECF RNA polymerase sigma factor SigJ [Paenibacillus plantiphilus]|uniref:ECF RNA polymerase sigma factor SigJ n=1 Tax=Paenibacillus plantiphilus TaxID=2905650 RepID=A0ABN8G3T3_9BACL|nr:sigma-70 family RNA polymerase sigma factor [Paenibacillus plantiphilus]CAH1199026.1 ECF RNA polymerase sigma factor SigJ [Paenibacillus plantiphilus]